MKRLGGHIKRSYEEFMAEMGWYTVYIGRAQCGHASPSRGALKGGNQLWSGWTVELGEQGLCKNIPVKTVKPMHLVAQSRIPDPWSNHYGLIGVEWYIAKNNPQKNKGLHTTSSWPIKVWWWFWWAWAAARIPPSYKSPDAPETATFRNILIIKYPLNPLGTFRKKLS